MIAELMVCNAAFAVIKETVQNTGNILDAAESLTQYFNSKTALKKKLNGKSGDKSDLEEWIALQKLEKYEQEFKEFLIYQGEAGQWDSWLQFQVEVRRKKEAIDAAETRKILKNRERIANVVNTVLVIILVSTGLFAIGGLLWAIYTKGQF